MLLQAGPTPNQALIAAAKAAMQGRGMELSFQDFYLPISRLMAVNPRVQDRRQRFAQFDSGCQYALSIVRADGAAKFSCLLRCDQA